MGSSFSFLSTDDFDDPVSILVLVALIAVVSYWTFFSGREAEARQSEEPTYTPIEKRDMTVAELLQYDGSDPSKPILFAVCGKIYDVTRGKDFYGPGENR